MRPFKFLLFLGLIAWGWCGQQCAAQGIYYAPAPYARAPLAAGAVYIARLIDARAQRTSLGWVREGGQLHKPAAFREGTLVTLRPFMAHYAPGQPGAVPLVMRLTGLEIAERLGKNSASQSGSVNVRGSEVAIAGLTADFYAPQPDSSYRLVAHFAQVREEGADTGLGNVTNHHATNVGELLLSAALLSRNQAAWLSNGPSYPAAYVLAAEPHAVEMLPILAPGMRPQPGLYRNLTDFWLNQPTEPGVPILEARPYLSTEWAGYSEVTPYRLIANGKRKLATDIWGFCDGKTFYVRRGDDFYPLLPQGQNFVFYCPIGKDPQYRAAASSRSMIATMGGLSGSALASAVAATDNHRALFTLSLLTGNVGLDQPSPTATQLTTARPTRLFIYRPRTAKGAAVRIRLAAGQPAQELVVGDYLTFEPASDQPLQVTMLSASGPEVVLVITPTAEVPTYLECRPAEAVSLRQVPDATGAVALTRLVK